MNPIDPKDIGKQIKQLVSNAELDKAIKRLLEFFNDKERYRALKNKLLLIKSMYTKARRDEELGIKSSEENKINFNNTSNQILKIADSLETGEFESEQVETKSKNITNILIWAGIGIILLLLALWLNPYKPKQDPSSITYKCPAYESNPDNIFPILILPFQPINTNGQIGGEITGADLQIARRFRSLSEAAAFTIDVQTLGPKEFALNADQYPVTFQDAASMASDCQAQLIIWGTTENQPDQRPIINRKFKFLNLGETFRLAKIQQVEEGSSIDTINTFTNIATGSQITEDIEAVLLGIVAYQKGDLKDAIEWLSMASPRDSATILMRGMFLAEAYLSNNQNEKALAVYNEVAKVHPEYALLNNNKGMLNYWAHHYTEAIEDFSNTLSVSPNDTAALTYRGAAYLMAEKLDKAQVDLQKAKSLKADAVTVDNKLKVLNTKIREQKRIQKQAESTINRSPNNVKALNTAASASLKLGDTDTAIRHAERALKVNAKDTIALTILLKAAEQANDQEKLENASRKALIEGVDLKKTLTPSTLNRINAKIKQ